LRHHTNAAEGDNSSLPSKSQFGTGTATFSSLCGRDRRVSCGAVNKTWVTQVDYDFDDFPPPSRRNRSLAWMGAVSGLALALFMFGSPGAASSSAPHIVAASTVTPMAQADQLTTSSIVPASPARIVDVTTTQVQNFPLPQSERHLLIVLLFVCFTVMAIGGLALWRRNWQEVVQRARPHDDL